MLLIDSIRARKFKTCALIYYINREFRIKKRDAVNLAKTVGLSKHEQTDFIIRYPCGCYESWKSHFERNEYTLCNECAENFNESI